MIQLSTLKKSGLTLALLLITLISRAQTVVVTTSANPICQGLPVTFTALFDNSTAALPATYSTAVMSSTLDEEIFNVSLGTGGSLLNNSSTCSNTGGLAGNGLPASILNRYSNYTTVSSVPVPNIYTGQSVPWSLNLGSCGTIAYSAGYSIFIDFNRNGVFTDAGEKVAGTSSMFTIVPAGQIFTGNFTVPATASLGKTVMRVVYRESTSAPLSVYTTGWGETEDYLVNIQGMPTTTTWTLPTTPTTTSTSNPLVYTPAVTGSSNYYVTCTNAANASFNGFTALNVLPAPTVPTATNSAQCGTQIPTASVASAAGTAGSGTMNWFAAATGGTSLQSSTSATYTSVISATTTFFVSEVGTNGCSSGRTPVTVTVSTPDALTAAASNTVNVCVNTPITLSVTKTGTANTYAYTWNATPATGSGVSASGTIAPGAGSLTVTPTAAGTYVYTISGFDGTSTPNCATTSSVTVNVIDPWNGFSITATPATASVCSGASTSLNYYIGPQSLPSGYGVSAATDIADEEILNVSLGTSGSLLNNTSSCATTGGAAGNGLPASDLNKYSNYTTTGLSVPTLVIGQTIPFSVQIGTCGGNWSNATKIYIDFNRNGLLTDAGEQVYASATTTSGPHFETGNISVPSTATAGVTLMRVVNVETSPASINPTGTYTWGETEDYMVNLGPAPIASVAWKEGASTLGTASSLAYSSSVIGNHTLFLEATSSLGGCKANSNNVVVTVNALPTAPSIGNSVQCGTKVPTNLATSTAGALGAGTFKWYTVATGGTPVETTTGGLMQSYQVTTTSTLYVSEMSVTGCESPRTPFLVTVNPIDPIFAAASGTSNVCVNTPIALTVTKTGTQNTYSYNWTATPQANSGLGTTGNTASLNTPIIITPSAAGTYSYKVTGTEAGTGCMVTSIIPVTVIDPWNGFTAIVAPATSTICSGTNVTLNALVLGSQAFPSGYTTTIPTYTGDEEITNVSLGASGALLNNSSTCTTTGGAAGNGLPASVQEKYSNFTTVSSVSVPNLTPGLVVPFSLSLGTCNGYYGAGWSIFIDYNRNGIFEASEKVAGTTVTDYATSATGSFTVPNTITNGKTLMRIVYAESYATPTAIQSYLWGETEDYAVNLVATSPSSYVWKEGTTTLGTASTLSYTGSVGSHYVGFTAASAQGCLISANPATVNVLALPTAPTATNSAHCGTKTPTASVTKTSGANGNGTFKWYTTPTGTTTAQVGTSTTFTSMISTTTTFYVSEVGVNGCESARTPVTITVTPADAITASASNTTNLCINTPVNLSVTQTGTNNTYLYTWTATPQAGSGIGVNGIPGTSPAPIAVTPTAAGTITYTVMGNQNGPAVYSNLAAILTADEDLGNVTITQGATTILNNTTSINSLVGSIGTATGTASLRSDFTAFGPYTLNAATTYNLSVGVITTGPSNWSNAVGVYIDYNRNGSFTDAGEQVYTSAALTSGAHTETATFTVPATALNGLTRMRVISNEGFVTNPEDPFIYYGEVEDYAINLVSSNIGGGNPTTGCTVYSTVNVNVINPWAGITATVTPATANICGLGTPVTLTGSAGGPTTMPTGYCATTNAGSACITNISFANLSNTSVCASASPYYTDYTSSVLPANVAPGQTYNFTISSALAITSVWFDWNRNGTFETTEWYQPYTSGTTITIPVTVPLTAQAGMSRFRVRSRLTGNINGAADGCTYMGSGETEDYAMMIGASTAAQTWTEATTTLGTATTLAYTPTSFGTKTITYTAADANGCKIAATATLNVSQPAAPVVANVTLCQNSTATALTATALTGHTVNWYTTATGGTALTSAPIPSTTTAGTTTYYATQTTPQGCESLRTPLDVIVNPAPAFTSASSIAPVCNQTAIAYTPTSSVTGATFAWSRAAVTGIATAANTGTAAINENLNNTTANPITVTYVYTTTNPTTGCTSTNNLTAIVNPAATLTSATSAPAICNNTVFAYTPTSATAGTTYAWSRATVTGISNAAGNGTGAINETLINTTANPVTVTYNYVLTANGCSNSQTITVVVYPSATLSSGLTGTVCSARPYKYTPLSATTGTTYAWSRAAVTGITNAAATGTGAISETLTNSTQSPINVTYVYTLTANGCTNTQNLVVTVNPTPAKLVITADGPTVFCKEESVVLRFNPINTGTYQWYQDGVPVSGATATNTTVYTAGSFTAIVTNSYGCASDPSTAMLVEVPCEIGISLPDIFTPNGDGSNDKIKPIVPGIHTFSFFRVYNRWGNLVFESTDPDAAWDGSYKGEMQPQDSYSYVIEGYNFRMELIRKQGTITLVR